jgi:phospholipid transport system substrate-binding protein
MWKRIIRVALLAAGFAGASLAATQVQAQAAVDGPDTLIRRAVDEVTATIKADKDIQAGNRQKINVLVDTKIAPYVNFNRMTQAAVGRNWAKATPEQQAALVREFKALLTNTYAGALSSYKPETVVEYRPLRYAAGETDAVVRSVIKGAGAEPIQLDYYLEKLEGAWKVVDMNVAGFRLVENYKGQFNGEITNSGIDGLIKKLAALNRANEAKAKS